MYSKINKKKSNFIRKVILILVIFFLFINYTFGDYKENIFKIWFELSKWYNNIKFLNNLNSKVNKVLKNISEKNKLKNNILKVWFSQKWKNKTFEFNNKISEVFLDKDSFKLSFESIWNFMYDDLIVMVWVHDKNLFRELKIWEWMEQSKLFNDWWYWYAMPKIMSYLIVSENIQWKYWFNYLFYNKNSPVNRIEITKNYKSKINSYYINISEMAFFEKGKFKKEDVLNFPKNDLYLIFFIDKNDNKIFDEWEIKKIKLIFK